MEKHIYIIIFLLSFCSYGQQITFKGDPDRAFEVARELAFNGKRKQAQDTLLSILTKYPNYNDIRSFLASTYSWDGDYKKAKKEFEKVLRNDPDRLDTWEAAIKNEMYSEEPYSALELVNKALKNFPNDAEILYLRASAEEKSNNKEEALLTLETILKSNPNHENALSFKESLLKYLRQNDIGFKASVDIYSEVFDPMQYYLIKYSRRTKFGSFHTKVNISNRFNSTGVQFEVDLYPRITKGLYAYANFGLANTFLYPDMRYGAELYKSLPFGLEVSTGFRALKYSSTTTIYTGSLGWYTGNNFWSFRTYITPSDSGSSKSGTLVYRTYRSDSDNFFSIDAGIGFSPETYRFEFEGKENAIVKLKSQKLNFGYYFTTKNNKNAWGIQTGVSHQEISFDPGAYFWIYSLSLSWDMRFR